VQLDRVRAALLLITRTNLSRFAKMLRYLVSCC